MKFQRFIQDYGVLVALALLVVINALRPGSVFLTPENLRNIINQSSFLGIVAIGMTLVIIAGGIDLSVGSLLALAGGTAVFVLNMGQPDSGGSVAIAFAVAVGVGLVLGAFNGALVNLGGLAPFIATLGGLVAFRSLLQVLANGGEIRSKSTELFPSIGNSGIPLPFKDGGGQTINLTWSILAWIILAVAAWFLLERTRYGRHLVAAGASEKAALYSGINVKAVRFWSYVILGGVSGLAGVLLSTRLNSVASGTSGLYYELDAIAAVVIGGTALSGGKGRIWGTVAGVLLLAIIGNMMVAFGVSSYWQGAVKGLIIVLAVLLQRVGKSSSSA